MSVQKFKKKTGIKLNEYGKKIEEEDETEEGNNNQNGDYSNPNDYLLKQGEQQNSKQNKKEYTPIKSYKPSGNLVYDDEILNKIENKFV